MVDISSSSSSYPNSADVVELALSEENVERLRNIRDMFENSDLTNDNQYELQRIEKLQPSEKIKDRLSNEYLKINLIMDHLHDETSGSLNNSLTDSLEDGINNRGEYSLRHDHDGHNYSYDDRDHNVNSRSNTPHSNISSISSSQIDNYLHDSRFNRFEEGIVDTDVADNRPKLKEEIIPFVELNTVKNKFEKNEIETVNTDLPKPKRCMTPPRDGINKAEIENRPMQRAADVISSEDRFEAPLPESGITRSRKEIFQHINESNDNVPNKSARVKSITPPRDEVRVLKEKTPERNENVIREADYYEEILPSAGTAKQTAALFTSPNVTLNKSIERSGITIEGELTEKGIAKSRLAMFSNNINNTTPNKETIELEPELLNTSGIAKDRLNLFKNLEQQATRNSPPKELKKKEFTPPPQLEPHQLQQRQYIIVDKETIDNNELVRESQRYEDYIPESGLAKSRLKQYLETATTSSLPITQQTYTVIDGEGGEQLPEKGTARNLVAKWKTIENVKEKETSPEHQSNINLKNENKQKSPVNVVNKDNETNEYLPQTGTAKNLLNKWQNIDKDKETNTIERKPLRQFTPPPQLDSLTQNSDDLATIEKGFAKNALANYESTPIESNINAQYNNDEDVIPSPGYAKQLKSKFQTLEKEASKVETSSAKLNYTPKRFTSSAKKQSNGHNGTTNGHGASDRCFACEKTVYAMEKIEADKRIYHKLCFKCSVCNCTLKLGNFSTIQEKLYCTPHYIQLFARNGNYDEGFGLETHKKKWIKT